jgi:serine/threonine-protein kinase
VSHVTRPDLPIAGPSGTIAGYRLHRYVGQGNTAVVYLAWDEQRSRPVALKMVVSELARDAAFRTRVIRESRAISAVEHPHVIPVYEAGEAGEVLYVAMRYVRGGDARSLLNQIGPFPIGYAWRIIAQIASALDAVHAHGLIHRDVRPANILLDADDNDHEPGHSYLADFGMSKAFSPDQIIATGQCAGTLDYAAPEQIEGRDLDGRADVYSLACTGFELLCGAPPFGPDQGLTLMYAHLYAPPPTATARRADLPAAVDPVLATALAKNPADRYPTCGRFAEELRAALALEPGESADPPRSRPPRDTGQASTLGLAAAVAEGEPDQQAATLELPTVKDQPAEPTAQPPAVSGRRDPATTTATATRPSGPEPRSQPASQPVSASEPASEPELEAEPGPLPELEAEPVPEPPAPRGRRVPRSAWLAAAVVAAAVAVASGLALSQRSAPARSAPAATSPAVSSPSARPTSSASASVPASQQAAALSLLLTSSAAARTALHDAVGQVGACTNLPGAVSQLQAVVNQRAGQYSQASALSTSALPDGARVKSALIMALGSSLAADRDYLTWARQQLTAGCTPTGQSSAYAAAYSASQRADAAKQAFVQVWNPVAARYGIKQDSPRDI